MAHIDQMLHVYIHKLFLVYIDETVFKFDDFETDNA